MKTDNKKPSAASRWIVVGLLVGITMVVSVAIYVLYRFGANRPTPDFFVPASDSRDELHGGDPDVSYSPDGTRAVRVSYNNDTDYSTFGIGRPLPADRSTALFSERFWPQDYKKGNVVVFAWRDNHRLEVRSPDGERLPPIPSEVEGVRISSGHFTPFAFGKNISTVSVDEFHVVATARKSWTPDFKGIQLDCTLELTSFDVANQERIEVFIAPIKAANYLLMTFQFIPISTDKTPIRTITSARINNLSFLATHFSQTPNSFGYSIHDATAPSRVVESLRTGHVNVEYDFDFGASTVRLSGVFESQQQIGEFEQCLDTPTLPPQH